jgi:hypothetical protein
MYANSYLFTAEAQRAQRFNYFQKKHLCVLRVSAVKKMHHGHADLTNRTGQIISFLKISALPPGA